MKKKKTVKKKKQESIFLVKNLSVVVFYTMLVLLTISIIAEIVNPNYRTNPGLYSVFGLIAGLVLKNVVSPNSN